ncbi:MAG TPA: polynucleotide adenylyltransferase PcnB [Woeseiaceae bacterium]
MKISGIQKASEPRIIPRPSHNVSRADISKSALKVLYRLNKAGYQAFLVGGCVRDALLGLHPKDFDVATNAHPDEVRALFSNCRLIGRRFRLAHVRFGREVIEVATFRGAAAPADGNGNGNGFDSDVAHDEQGRILRDNVYGTVEEDVWRRDFTCNALYYNIADFSIWDYVGGMDDIRARRLVLIGDPVKRLREDPVRMLRAVRFAAKLDFTIDHAAALAIAETRTLLRNVPPARLFDEFLKMFQLGHAQRTFELLRAHRLFELLFPETAEHLDRDENFLRFVERALASTDERVAHGQAVTPMFLIGVFLWAPVTRFAEELREQGQVSDVESLAVAAREITLMQQSRIALPRRFTAPMCDMLAMQPRFEVRRGRRALGFLEHRRFRAAYDFMMLRAEVGEVDRETADFWTAVQTQNQEQRLQTFELSAAKKRRRRKPRRRRSAGQA